MRVCTVFGADSIPVRFRARSAMDGQTLATRATSADTAVLDQTHRCIPIRVQCVRVCSAQLPVRLRRARPPARFVPGSGIDIRVQN